MSYYTKYAEKKFDILNKHKVYFRCEQIEEAIKLPDKVKKRRKNYFVKKDSVGVVYRKEDGAIKIITFYPVN